VTGVGLLKKIRGTGRQHFQPVKKEYSANKVLLGETHEGTGQEEDQKKRRPNPSIKWRF